MNEEIVIDNETGAVHEMLPSAPLALRPLSPEAWQAIKEQSASLEQAGKGTKILPPGITTRYQIAAILQKGAELGLPALYSLEQIALINGKPMIQSQALMAIVQRAHGRGAIRIKESNSERCTVIFSDREGNRLGEVSWTMEDAKQAQLDSKQGPWKQYPRVMLRWRAIAEGCRVFFADTIAGLYMPDELGTPYVLNAAGDLEIDREALGPPKPVATESPDPPRQEQRQERPRERRTSSDAPTAQEKEELLRLLDERAKHGAPSGGTVKAMAHFVRIANKEGCSTKVFSQLDRATYDTVMARLVDELEEASYDEEPLAEEDTPEDGLWPDEGGEA